MRRTTIAALTVSALAVTLPALAAAQPAPPEAIEPGRTRAAPPRVPGVPGVPGADPVVNLVSVCNFSHAASDDPIVFPDDPGASHLHQFFGNTSTAAASTPASMAEAGTTCTRLGDTAAYWVPALTDAGEVQRPSRAQAYYTLAGKDPSTITAFPADLRMIAGGQDAPLASRWGCADPDAREPLTAGAAMPSCEEGEHLIARVVFPDCWDGERLDSADHRSHVTYSRRGTCPDTHAVALPRLRLTVHYPGADGGDDVTLASGSPTTLHADFWNTWDQDALEGLVEACLVAEQRCGSVGGPDGR